jgi:hypothetical protein
MTIREHSQRHIDPTVQIGTPHLSYRKLRLFAVAVCRSLAPRVNHPAIESALLAAETYADTGLTKIALKRGLHGIEAALRDSDVASRQDFYWQLEATKSTVYEFAVHTISVSGLAAVMVVEKSVRADAKTRLATLYAEVAGPASVAFAPEWRTSTAVALARTMYDARDFAAMPILADALQDAGCEDAAVLAHCRGPGPHVRGCWVVDRVLGLG